MLLSEITGFNKMSAKHQEAAAHEAHDDHGDKMSNLIGAIKAEMKLDAEDAEAVAGYLNGDTSGHGFEIAYAWGVEHHRLKVEGGDDEDTEKVSKMLWDMFDEELKHMDGDGDI